MKINLFLSWQLPSLCRDHRYIYRSFFWIYVPTISAYPDLDLYITFRKENATHEMLGLTLYSMQPALISCLLKVVVNEFESPQV